VRIPPERSEYDCIVTRAPATTWLTATAKTVFVKEGEATSFILEYFHPAGIKSCTRITKLPKHGRLVQKLSTADHVVPITSVPFDCSSHAFAMLVTASDKRVVLPRLLAAPTFLATFVSRCIRPKWRTTAAISSRFRRWTHPNSRRMQSLPSNSLPSTTYLWREGRLLPFLRTTREAFESSLMAATWTPSLSLSFMQLLHAVAEQREDLRDRSERHTDVDRKCLRRLSGVSSLVT
jgi:hypothetical protein